MSEAAHSVAGVVVLYNPPDYVFDEISSYIGQVSKVFVIDNSVQYNESLIKRLRGIDKIVYVNNRGNVGIAAALNTGAMLALEEGYTYLLTMDQDTALPPNFVSDLVTGFGENLSEKIGIIAPSYTSRTSIARYESIPLTMTSGNILNLAAFREIGPFLEELFIDHVDHEFCLRLRRAGYSVVQANQVAIVHRPGHLVQFKVIGKSYGFSSHSPLRLYYFVRNGFYVTQLYRDFPEFRSFFRTLLMKELLKIPFETNKIGRLKMMIRGYKDYRANKLGMYNQIEG